MPATRAGLQEVQAELDRQVVATDVQLGTAIRERNKSNERALRIVLNELNSKLMLIHSHLRAFDLPAVLNDAASAI